MLGLRLMLDGKWDSSTSTDYHNQCKSWRCPDHRQALAWSWACRVARARPQHMVTLTNIPQDKAKAAGAGAGMPRGAGQACRSWSWCAAELVRPTGAGAVEWWGGYVKW